MEKSPIFIAMLELKSFFNFLNLDPQADEFQNLNNYSLSKVTSMVKFSRKPDR